MSAARVEKWAFAAMALGVALVLQPWGSTLRWGFFVTLAGVVAQTVAAHWPAKAIDAARPRAQSHEQPGERAP